MVVILAACSAPPVETPPSSPPASPPSSPSARPDGPAKNITIERVEIANPIAIEGRARTFENHVTFRARNAGGEVIAQDYATATGEIGHHNPYRGTLWLTRDPGPRIVIEALEHSAKDGSEQSLVRAERPFDVELIDVTLYLPDENCTAVHPQTRRIPKSIAMARLLVEALMADPKSPFPKGSRVESVNLRGGVLTVDFNERLQNVGGACAAQMIRASVTETLKRLPSVQNVVITAGGSEKLALQP